MKYGNHSTRPKLPVSIIDEKYIADADGDFIVEAFMWEHQQLLPTIVDEINADINITTLDIGERTITIPFSRNVRFLGRNGVFTATGMRVSMRVSSWKHGRGNGCDLYVEPITSKNEPGRCRLEIPSEDVPHLVTALLSPLTIRERAAVLRRALKGRP